jgi:hypothetical protein
VFVIVGRIRGRGVTVGKGFCRSLCVRAPDVNPVISNAA